MQGLAATYATTYLGSKPGFRRAEQSDRHVFKFWKASTVLSGFNVFYSNQNLLLKFIELLHYCYIEI